MPILTLDCPLCGPTEFKTRFTKKGRDFYRCKSCGIELQNPLPTADELADFYDDSFNDGMYCEFALAKDLKQATAQQRIKEIESTVPLTGKWLDVGCANGVFVESVGRTVQAQGIEISQTAVLSGRDRNLDLYQGTIDDVPVSNHYDCITGFDILEHVIDPRSFLTSIFDRVADGGYVVLTVPNSGGIIRKLMGKRWYFYIPEEHLHYFNRVNLSDLLTQTGFDVVNVAATHKPMTYNYALTQFEEFNPLIFKVLQAMSSLIPRPLKDKPIPLPIGEIMIIGQKPGFVLDESPLDAAGSSRNVVANH